MTLSCIVMLDMVSCQRNRFIRVMDPQPIAMTNTYQKKMPATSIIHAGQKRQLFEEDLFS
jgi:hypothetical protein